jgi:hypothetical protein
MRLDWLQCLGGRHAARAAVHGSDLGDQHSACRTWDRHVFTEMHNEKDGAALASQLAYSRTYSGTH